MLTTRPPLLYRLVQFALAPVVVFYFLARYFTNRSYQPYFLQRLGRLPKSFSRTKAGSIWLHAVSVGEVASALPLLRELRSLFPKVPLYLSVTTVAGRKAAERQASALVDGLFYAPVDYASCVRRALSSIRPAMLIILETEIWPNLFFETVRTGARLVVVNGRISNRTWPQYQAWRWFFCPVLQLPDLILVQSATDLQRYRRLGAPEGTSELAGNLKYDAACSATPVVISTFGAQQVWIAASTVGPNERGSLQRHFVDEDDVVLNAFSELAHEFPKLLLILAPRQPERFSAVLAKLSARGLSFARRSTADARLSLPGVLLLDTIGELAGLYPLANVVFVGGSIAPRGGHNILEPAAAGAPIVTGMNMQNFESIARDFASVDALTQVAGQAELLTAIRYLLQHPEAGAAMGQRARCLVEEKRGVSRMVAKRLVPLYYSASLQRPWSAAARLLLAPFAFLWKHGGRIMRDRSEQRAASLLPLPVPVVSVGGISVGGSGKTPFVDYLTRTLRHKGQSPSILTRGYRRRYPAEHLIFGCGAKVSPFFTGDEAQIFLRAGNATVGIGAKRYETALILLRHYPSTDVLVLDDGFQHALMTRDLDIVVIDGLEPFGREELVPLGRLREPLSALERADIFIITRATDNRRFQAIKSRLLQYNAHAPAFRTTLIARAWRDYFSGEVVENLKGKRVGAFCGLGNPQNFWDTLESLGLEVVFRWAFEDHHSYKPSELARVTHQARMHGAEWLVTTEKDRINCPNQLDRTIAALPIAWLEIDLELEEEAKFLAVLSSSLKLKMNGAGERS